MTEPGDGKRTAIVLGVAGIVIEVVTVVLLASGRVTDRVATPFVVTGMLMAFVPLFVVARRARRR